MTHPNDHGIEALGLAFPALALPCHELAALRGVDPAKYDKGLGVGHIALCAPDETVVTLAATAASRAIARWGGDVSRIGLIAVGSETAQDMSRPLSAFVAEKLGLVGTYRSYETKHACYGGTVALRQAVEWRASGAARGRVALVIAADEALYAEGDPGEPTQGAGAVAMIVGEPSVASVGLHSYAWAEPAFDFWRPVGEAYPRVDGPKSLDCYKRAAAECFGQLVSQRSAREVLFGYSRTCFHVPFPKMVQKASLHVCETLGLSAEEGQAFWAERVEPTMGWNRETGNSYTAALWVAVAHSLRGMSPGTRLAAFSYGSGYGSELLELSAGPLASAGAWSEDVETDLRKRQVLRAGEYAQLRHGRSHV
jgi:hydroxymethylglutaryl-CoA synthase